MARQARMAFKALKIPESDPAWNNVRYRPTASAIPAVPAPPPMAPSNSSRSSTSAQAESKRAATTTKDTKLKSKQDPSRVKGEIQMKDESTKPSASRLNAVKRAEPDRPTPPSDGGTPTKTIASRRLPGSGYQVKKSPQPSTGPAEKSDTPTDARPASKPPLPASLPPKPTPAVPLAGGSHTRKTVPTMPPRPTKKGDESDREREREYERHREREREKRERKREKERQRDERERERAETEKHDKAKHKEREVMEREKRQREKVQEREEMGSDKRQREKERKEKEKEKGAASAAPAFKRKPATQDTEETLDDASSKGSLPKRRKLDDGSSVASSSKARDAEMPKKPAHEPSPVPRLKMKKDLSSPQALASSHDRRTTTSASGSTHKSERPSKASGSAKPRRRSPIYTSSEDEGEIRQPRKRNPSPPPVSDRSNSSDLPSSERAPHHHRTTRRVYPTDHAALRALYQSQYTSYLGTFSKVVAQKRKIEAMLNGDSEAEMDVMDPDELIKLSMEHKTLKTELEHIHDVYTRGTGGGSASD